jgi:alkaline phosphatase D
MLLDIGPAKTTAVFQALDDVHDKTSKLGTAASFVVRDGKAGLN